MFGDQAVIGFLQQCETHIVQMTKPEMFAEFFLAQYPGEATRMATEFQPEDAIGFTKSFMDAVASPTQSPILLASGKKWLHELWAALRQRIPAGPPAATAQVS